MIISCTCRLKNVYVCVCVCVFVLISFWAIHFIIKTCSCKARFDAGVTSQQLCTTATTKEEKEGSV